MSAIVRCAAIAFIAISAAVTGGLLNPALADELAPTTEATGESSASSLPSADTLLDALDARVDAMLVKGKKACAADLQKYCSTIEPGEGRLAFCLIAHADKRSPTCNAAIADARIEAEVIINEISRSIDACAPDIDSLCRGTEPGEGRIAQCLLDQRDALSSSCGRVLNKLSSVILRPSTQVAADGAAGAEAGESTEAAASSEEVASSATASSTAIVDSALQTLEDKVQVIVAKGKRGCAADLERYCSTVEPGEGRLAFCLIAHADKRSSECEIALGEARSEAEDLIADIAEKIEACAPDIAALCAGTTPGEGRIAQCLVEQRSSLTESCARVVDSVSKIVFAPGNKAAEAAPSPGEAAQQVATGAISETSEPELERKVCRSLEVSVTDWGKAETQSDARKLLRGRVGAYAAKNGIHEFTSRTSNVGCSENLNLLVAGYYTCRARTRVCWTVAAQGEARGASENEGLQDAQ